MLQVEIVTGDIAANGLQNAVNEFLKGLQDEDAVKDINVQASEGIATILYVVKESWKGNMCCDCRYWDDSNDCEALIGLCQVCGGRRRFNNNSCKHFKDIRG